MALVLKRVLGRDVTVTLTGGRITVWDKISISLPDDDFEGTAADSPFKQYVKGQLGQGTISISGFISGDNTAIPASGDLVTAINIAVSTDSLLPADILTAAVRGKWRVRNPKIDFMAGPATCSFELKSGYID